MAEGVDHHRVAAVGVVGRRPVEVAPGLDHPADAFIDVAHRHVEGDRGAFTLDRGGEPDAGVLVGQHDHAAGQLQLGVAHATVGHDDGLAPESGPEGVGVPGQRPPGVADRQVRDHAGRAGVGVGGVGRGRLGDGRARHVGSFGEVEGALQAGAQAGREVGVGLDGLDRGAQRVERVMHRRPPRLRRPDGRRGGLAPAGPRWRARCDRGAPPPRPPEGRPGTAA